MADGVEQEESQAAARVRAALTQVLRWASRPDVQRSMLGPAGKDLSPTDTWLLSAVDERGPLRISDLATWQGVDKSTVTPQVRRLESRGLIRRAPDPSDGRAQLLSITARGRQLRRRTAATGSAVVQQLLQSWRDDDQQALADLLSRFAEELEGKRPQM